MRAGSDQRLWVIIPVKPFSEAKSRLAGVLGPDERIALSQKLFRQTLAAALASRAGVTLVISRSASVRAMASDAGAKAVPESGHPRPRGDLNAALEEGRDHARRAGAHALITLSADLPWVSREDIDALLPETATMQGTSDAPTGRIVLAPDRHRSGTNATYQSPVDALPFCFGPDSLAKHRQLARAAFGEPPALIERLGLQFDVDTETDLEELREAEKRYDGHRSATCERH
ncbi:MAG: 2-phospho-L-lactate guanylyltransferase [Pseudomonadota bacterium]